MNAPMAEVMPSFALARPATVEDALAARAGAAQPRWLAGGTDLLVNLRRGIGAPDLLIDLSGIADMRGIEAAGGALRIGAATTLAEIAAHAGLRARWSAVAQAAACVAGPGHRHVATLGGNLCLDTRCVFYNQSEWWRRSNDYCLKHRGEVCHVAPQGNTCRAAFSGDVAPALMVHDAEVEIAGPAGRKRIGLDDLYREDGRAHLALAADELLVAVHLPATARVSAYEKTRVRGAIDFPLAGVAVALGADGGRVAHLAVALTGTNSRPLRLAGTEDLHGVPLDAAALDRLDKLVQKQVSPMRTTALPAQYRRLAAAALAKRLTMRLMDGAGRGD